MWNEVFTTLVGLARNCSSVRFAMYNTKCRALRLSVQGRRQLCIRVCRSRLKPVSRRRQRRPGALRADQRACR